MRTIRSNPTPLPVALAAVWLLAACAGPEEEPARQAVIRDSAGVQVVESPAPAWTGGEGWSVGGVLLTVGDEGTELVDVVDAVRLTEDGLVIADGGTGELLYFDGAGAPLRAAGGMGDGPGEFRILQAMGLTPGDSVWAYDFSHRRITWLDPEGEVAGVVPIRPGLSSGVVVGRFPDGSFLAAQMWSVAGGEIPPEGMLSRSPVVYARYGPEGDLADTLGLFPGRELHLTSEGGRTVMGAAPFARASSHAVLDGRWVVGDQVGYELQVRDASGALVRVIRWDGPDLELTQDEIAAWKERQLQDVAPARRPSVRAYLAEAPLPERRPAYGDVLPDAAGGIWVAAYAHASEAPGRWDVFDAVGRWLGPVEMPTGFRPLTVGADWVLGVRTDEWDVQRVELRSLPRGG